MRSIDEFTEKLTLYQTGLQGANGNQRIDEHMDKLATFVGKVAEIFSKVGRYEIME